MFYNQIAVCIRRCLGLKLARFREFEYEIRFDSDERTIDRWCNNSILIKRTANTGCIMHYAHASIMMPIAFGTIMTLGNWSVNIMSVRNLPRCSGPTKWFFWQSFCGKYVNISSWICSFVSSSLLLAYIPNIEWLFGRLYRNYYLLGYTLLWKLHELLNLYENVISVRYAHSYINIM